ncbi:uncharacterized protein LOC144352605 [Saccoglossus kowalevskii]
MTEIKTKDDILLDENIKSKLIELVELANELKVRPLEPDDRETSSKRRRTVQDKESTLTLEDPEHGSCKHCVALLFSIQDFDSRHKDRATQPRKKIMP